ncbi:hypothetical protein SKAU_G00201340 [Synaphobranchus kaupii]|uniref:Uncharacterized protein n=1 Tax=Synaphobranchus kaupii TaxID=118154 RepID=A0A9Q1IYF0_SYNKA|nr:hypothetical protein SKAU_G00201340 [Synaphobranchus kaupii]
MLRKRGSYEQSIPPEEARGIEKKAFSPQCVTRPAETTGVQSGGDVLPLVSLKRNSLDFTNKEGAILLLYRPCSASVRSGVRQEGIGKV